MNLSVSMVKSRDFLRIPERESERKKVYKRRNRYIKIRKSRKKTEHD